jgi:hypothetical protein
MVDFFSFGQFFLNYRSSPWQTLSLNFDKQMALPLFRAIVHKII